MAANKMSLPSHRRQTVKHIQIRNIERRKRWLRRISQDKREALLTTKRFRLSPLDKHPNYNRETEDVESLIEDFVQQTKGKDKKAQLKAIQALRNAVSFQYDLISESNKCKIVKVVAPFLQGGVIPELALEASWIVSNLASGTSSAILEALLGVTYLLIHHIEESTDVVAEQCAMAIGNIAGENESIRMTLLKQNAMQSLHKMFVKGLKDNQIGITAGWAISNMVRGPFLEAISTLFHLPKIEEHLLLALKDNQMVIEVAWIYAYIADSPPQYFHKILTYDFIDTLLSILSTSKDENVSMALFHVLGNACAEGGERTISFIGRRHFSGLIGVLYNSLLSNKHLLQKEASFALSNIVAIPNTEILASIKQSTLLNALYNLLNHPNVDVTKQVAYTIANICAGNDYEAIGQLQEAISHDAMRSFLNLTQSCEAEMAYLGLQFIEMALRKLPQGISLLNECNGGNIIEKLKCTSENEQITRMATYLLDNFLVNA